MSSTLIKKILFDFFNTDMKKINKSIIISKNINNIDIIYNIENEKKTYISISHDINEVWIKFLNLYYNTILQEDDIKILIKYFKNNDFKNILKFECGIIEFHSNFKNVELIIKNLLKQEILQDYTKVINNIGKYNYTNRLNKLKNKCIEKQKNKKLYNIVINELKNRYLENRKIRKLYNNIINELKNKFDTYFFYIV
jgi:hypothetical protein